MGNNFRLRVLAGSGLVAGLLCAATPAQAAGEVVSVTFSPLHLFLPVFEAQAEVRLMPAMGLAAIGGIGSITSNHITFGVTEVGGQVAFYPLDDFRSLQLGAEVMWVHVSGEVGAVTGVGTGLAAGPFIGYKLLARQGFTFFAQGGAQYMFAHAEASSTSGESASKSQSAIGVLLNLNLGWSF